jgi:glutamine synthetase
MRQTRKRANALTDMRARAIAYHDDVIPLMTAVRKKIDKLEEIVDDSLWPLPKYRELLFAN